MWKMSQRSNQVWGVGGYEVPVLHYDCAKSKKDRENYVFSVGKKKRPVEKLNMSVKRGGIFDDIAKHTNAKPSPWSYDIKQKWLTGHKKYPNPLPAPKKMQKFKYKWKKLKEGEEAIIEEPPKVGGKENKPDMRANKNTFIDQIIAKNTKKRYPTPSPATYFKTEKLIKKMDDKAELYERKGKKDETKPFNCSQAKRDLSLVRNPEISAKEPGPGTYEVIPARKIKENSLTYKNYKNKLKDDQKRRKDYKDLVKGIVEEKKSKINGDIPKFPEPIPADYATFSKYKKKFGGKKIGAREKKPDNGRGFAASAPRFPIPENERWKKRVAKHNGAAAEGLRTLDDKKDPTPGPAQYNLTAHWTRKTKKSGSKKLPNIFKSTSKAPTFSVYHKRR